MKTYKLSKEEFLETFRKVPRVGISLLITKENQVLLTKRKEDPLKDFWHLPGSFIFKNEAVKECIRRVLKEELGFTNNVTYELEFLSEDLDEDPRGHVINLIYKVKISEDSVLKAVGRTKEFEYFEKIPDKIGFGHGDVLRKLGFGL